MNHHRLDAGAYYGVPTDSVEIRAADRSYRAALERARALIDAALEEMTDGE